MACLSETRWGLFNQDTLYFSILGDFVLGVYKHREVSHFFRCEISYGMHSKSYLRTPWGSSYEHICNNIYLLQRLNWVITMVDKSVKNYIERCSTTTARPNTIGELFSNYCFQRRSGTELITTTMTRTGWRTRIYWGT